MKEESTKAKLIEAFNKSESMSVTETCRIANVTRGTYYFHFYKDADFRREMLTRQQHRMAEKIAKI